MNNIDWYSPITLQESNNVELNINSDLFEPEDNFFSLYSDLLNNFSGTNVLHSCFDDNFTETPALTCLEAPYNTNFAEISIFPGLKK